MRYSVPRDELVNLLMAYIDLDLIMNYNGDEDDEVLINKYGGNSVREAAEKFREAEEE